MNSILISGGSGFFGKAFVKECLARGVPRICIFSRGEARQAAMRAELGDPAACRWFIGDVRDRWRLRRAMEGVEVIVHAAALKRIAVGEYNPSEMVRTNIGGAENVIEASIDARVQKVVALSTDKAVAPINCYGATKLVMEKLFLSAPALGGAHGPSFGLVRYGNIAGSTGSVIPMWREALANGEPVFVTDPAATRFWMMASEAVALVWRAIETGDPLTIPDLPAFSLADLAEAMGIQTWTRTELGRGEKLHESLLGELEPYGPRTSDKARRMTVDELRSALGSV